jgi:pimeloyl-ACP methyl ester carboxylesterase
LKRPTLVVLHGANGCGAEMEPLAAVMRPYAEVLTPDLAGHGQREPLAEFTIESLADDLVELIVRERLERPILLGYSIGGYVALRAAFLAPERIRAVCTIAVKHVFDDGTARRWMFIGTPAYIRETKPWRVAELERAHPGRDWEDVARASVRLFERLGERAPLAPEDLAAIRVPVLAISSDRDQLVPWAETVALGRTIPGCRVAMFYGVAHPLRVLPFLALARTIKNWMQELPA